MKTSLILIASTLLFACGGSTPPAAEPTAPAPAADGAAPAAAAADTTADAFGTQAKAGQALYGQNCAGCHGANGNDGKAPPLVGLSQGALPLNPAPSAKMRKTEFKTVADVAAFVVKTMPPKAPGNLSEDEYYAILAFDLKANGIDLGDKKLDAALASTLEIPRK